jgi:hypothetical protein
MVLCLPHMSIGTSCRKIRRHFDWGSKYFS